MAIKITRPGGVPYLDVDGKLVPITQGEISIMKGQDLKTFRDHYRMVWMPQLSRVARDTLRTADPAEVYAAIQADAGGNEDDTDEDDNGDPPIPINPASFGGPKKN